MPSSFSPPGNGSFAYHEAEKTSPRATTGVRAICSRRNFTAAVLASSYALKQAWSVEPGFQFRYLLASCLYGYQDLSQIVPEVRKTGATAIDIWPKVHGNQREQIDAMGESKFADLLQTHDVSLGCITQYQLGPFGLQDEMRFASRFGCSTIVTSAQGPVGLSGTELKSAIEKFVSQMRPHLEVAEECGVTIAIENHAKNLLESPDAIRWLADLSGESKLAIALAPYHLPQESAAMAKLILELGNRIAVFYAWQHGAGCMQKQPKEQELLQMPGRGSLDFAPLVASLQQIQFQGWTSIFMHPFPRGIPILDSVEEVTAEINRARDYLQGLIG